MARTITSRKTRATLIEMAQVWQRLADEQNGSLSRSAVEEPQQQQIQPNDDDEKE
jgi:hypothetical protein